MFFIYVIYIYSYIHCIFLQSLLSRYKWNRFGRYVYLIMLLLYVLFLLALTIYTVSAPAPYSPSQIIELAKKYVSWGPFFNDVRIFSGFGHLPPLSVFHATY